MELLRKAEYEKMIASTRDERMDWWRKARFGMFVHFGLYSIIGRHEWVMSMEGIDKEEYEKINRRRNTFIKETGLHHASWLTMITTEGLAKGMYSGMIQNVVKLDDLFG